MSDVRTPTGIELPKALELRTSRDPARERAQVAQLAQEFEAMLMLQMVRGMRQSFLDEDSKDGELFGGQTFGGATLGDTFDTELTRHLAKSGGVGLGRWVADRVAEQTGGDAAAAVKDALKDAGETPSFQGVTAPALLPLHETAAPKPLDEGRAIDLTAAVARRVSAIRQPFDDGGRQADIASDDFRLSMPLESVTTSAFGWRRDPLNGRQTFHHGVDLRAAYGDAVPAAAPGTVVFAGERGGYGNVVIVRHEGGMETRYAHLSSVDVAVGDAVENGTTLGRAGSTGRSTAPHLHFEVLVNGERVDPERVAARLGRGPLKFVSQADD